LNPSYTVVTCHFGSTFWIKKCLHQLDKFSDERLKEVVVVNQDRVDLPELSDLPRVSQVVTFPLNEDEVAVFGHDHPSALNSAIHSLEFSTSHVIILDSDCFPTNSSWLDSLSDVVLAADPEKTGLTHPCFMCLPVESLSGISFSEGVVGLGIDTGRLVGAQLLRHGYRPEILPAKRAFSGLKGHFYKGESIFHFGSGSFAHSADPRLLSQVSKVVDQHLLKKISKNVFKLTFPESLFFATMLAFFRFKDVLSGRQ